MMEEKLVRNEERIKIAREFSDVCKNNGRTSFAIIYTVTDGNLEIDKDFQEFCFKYTNNEYLAGIGLLLKVFKHYEELSGLGNYLEQVDNRLKIVEDKLNGVKEDGVQKEDKKEIKTF